MVNSYGNILSTLTSTIEYNAAEIASLEGSTNSDDVARIQKLTDENKKLNEGILQIQSDTSTLNENIDTINELTAYTSSIIESESILTSDRLAKMKSESSNKMRMVEINNYYANKYNDQSDIMKIIIFTCIVVLFLWYINTIVESSIFYVLIAIVVAIGVIIVFWKSYYLMLRNNIDYNQFEFDVKPAKLPKIDTKIQGTTGPSRISKGDAGAKGCINEACCTGPEYYSFNTGKCYSSIAGATYASFQ
jgi:hypothetical protein